MTISAKNHRTVKAFDGDPVWLRLLVVSSNRSRVLRSIDGQSNKVLLVVPTPDQLAKLAKKSRKVLSANPIITVEKPIVWSVSAAWRIASARNYSEAGETLQALANEYRLLETGLSEMLLTAKVQIKKTPITELNSDRVVALYESGLSVRQIVVELGYSVGTIRRVLKERDVKMRVRGRSWMSLRFLVCGTSALLLIAPGAGNILRY